jgi:hypothetical protein
MSVLRKGTYANETQSFFLIAGEPLPSLDISGNLIVTGAGAFGEGLVIPDASAVSLTNLSGNVADVYYGYGVGGGNSLRLDVSGASRTMSFQMFPDATETTFKMVGNNAVEIASFRPDTITLNAPVTISGTLDMSQNALFADSFFGSNVDIGFLDVSENATVDGILTVSNGFILNAPVKNTTGTVPFLNFCGLKTGVTGTGAGWTSMTNWSVAPGSPNVAFNYAGAAFDFSAGAFIAPVTGIYRFALMWRVPDGGSQNGIRLIIDGTTPTQDYENVAAAGSSCGFAEYQLVLNSGQTVIVQQTGQNINYINFFGELKVQVA